MTGVRLSRGGVMLVLLLALVGCRGDPGPAATGTPVPDELVGAWSVVTERRNGFSYEISAAGRYVFLGIMQAETQQYTLEEIGTVQVQGEQVTFDPDQVTISRSDSATPGENFRRPTDRPARTATWSVTGDTLTLTEGSESTTYQRA